MTKGGLEHRERAWLRNNSGGHLAASLQLRFGRLWPRSSLIPSFALRWPGPSWSSAALAPPGIYCSNLPALTTCTPSDCTPR
jgi:hypothetical protein